MTARYRLAATRLPTLFIPATPPSVAGRGVPGRHRHWCRPRRYLFPAGGVTGRRRCRRVVVEHRALVERVLPGEHLPRPYPIELSRPRTHEDCGDRVAGEVCQRPG